MKTEAEEMVHWPVGGSTAYRTTKCTGWVLAAKLARDKAKALGVLRPAPPNEPAERGTLMHHWLEVGLTLAHELTGDVSPARADMVHVISSYYTSHETNEDAELLGVDDDASAIAEAILDKVYPTMVESEAAYPKAKRLETWIEKSFTEQRPQYEDIIGGTTDFGCIYYDENDVLTLAIADFKSGDGELQEVNPGAINTVLAQMAFYAALAYWDASAEHDIKQVELTVWHAWRDAFVPTSVLFLLEDFLDLWNGEMHAGIYAAAAAMETGDPAGTSLAAGSWCKYCPCAAQCPELYRSAHQALRLDTGEASNLGKVLDLVPALEELVTSAQKLATDAVKGGTKIPGHKLVINSKRETWDDTTSEEWLAFRGAMKKTNHALVKTGKETFATPKAMKKALGLSDEEFKLAHGDLTSTSISHKVVPETDRRKAVLSTDAMRDALKQLEMRT